MRLEVMDNGIGMTPEELGMIFNRFVQANKKTSEYGGSGLGLVLTKSMTELMGGEISVESNEGEGTTFSVVIDFAVAPAVSSEDVTDMMTDKQEAKEKDAISGKHILVVEDNEVNQRILQRHLKAHSCEYLVARNGKEAYETMVAKWEWVDVVLMDIEMPVMNGLESTAAIRENERKREEEEGEKEGEGEREGKAKRRRKPIIGLSGNARKEQIETAIAAGMDDYLVKPYTKETLMKMIGKWC